MGHRKHTILGLYRGGVVAQSVTEVSGNYTMSLVGATAGIANTSAIVRGVYGFLIRVVHLRVGVL